MDSRIFFSVAWEIHKEKYRYRQEESEEKNRRIYSPHTFDCKKENLGTKVTLLAEIQLSVVGATF